MKEILTNIFDKFKNKTDFEFTPEYWEDMAKRSSAADYTKSKDCYGWTKEAERILEAEGFKKLFRFRGVQDKDGSLLKEFGIWGHTWLEHSSDNQDRFIADGTAGQIIPDMQNGYYGYFSDAPEPLKKIYSM